jgi:orotate phosphoribosyltransferase
MSVKTKKKNYEVLVKRPAIMNKNEFVYTAGYTGYDFFDLSKLTLSPKTSGDVVGMYVDSLEKVKREGLEFNKLAFIERTIGPMTIASQLSSKGNLEIVVIRTKVPCSCKLCETKLRIKSSVEPPLFKDDRVVIVTDVVTTGGTVLDAINIIKKAGAKVVAVIAILDRQTNVKGKTGKERIEEEGAKLFSYYTRDELLTLGFAMPSEEDLRQKDFLLDLSKAIYLSEEETGLGKSLFDSLAEEILKNKKGAEINEENKRYIRNMLTSIAVSTRVSVLQSTELMEVKEE